jgi:hypothetical protein
VFLNALILAVFGMIPGLMKKLAGKKKNLPA